MALVCLREMKKNSSGFIKKINGSRDMERRIRDLGLFSGVWFKVEGRAPLKDPVALRLKNCKITLRNNEADLIMVEPEGGAI
jgi:ferrous iron transport protein A